MSNYEMPTMKVTVEEVIVDRSEGKETRTTKIILIDGEPREGVVNYAAKGVTPYGREFGSAKFTQRSDAGILSIATAALNALEHGGMPNS